MDSVTKKVQQIRQKAAELRDTFGDEARARSLEWAAAEVERAVHVADDEIIGLNEASRMSGYSVEHLGRLVRTGKIADARKSGSRGRVLVRRRDVPKKPAFCYIADAETHDLASRLLGGKER